MRPESNTSRLVLALLAALVSSPRPAAAQSEPRCGDGRITYVFVDNNSVFDVDELGQDQPFRWAYEVANRLHMRTSEDFIHDELLFGAGDCYDPVLLEESERLLRNYDFIATVDIYGIRQRDGNWHVIVYTQDEWTTKINFDVSVDQGLEFRGMDVTEENLLGEGITAGVFYRRREERRDLGARFFTPQLFGTRLDASLKVGRTRVGNFFEQSFFYPFVGEVGRLAGRELYVNREELFTYYLPGSHDRILLPVDEERLELMVAGRLGRPGNLTLFGLGFSNETLEFPGYPDDVERAPDGDYDHLEPAPEERARALASQTLHSSATRVNLLFGQRNVRFVQRRGLDALDGQQDVPLGVDVGLTLGRSLEALSAGQDQPDDLYTRLRFFAGWASGNVLGNLYAAWEGRQVFSGGPEGRGWIDMLGELDGFLYWQPWSRPGNTVLFRVAGAGGWNVNMPYQLTLGGESGVRGYRQEDFPGGRRAVFSVEERLGVDWPAPDLFDFGFTLFGDVGRMWAGDAPFGADSGWRGSVGAGLRLGFPAGTRGVVRFDAALPVGDGAGPGDIVFRISLLDLIGLRGGIVDQQLERSRRITVGPDVFTPRRR